MKAVTCHGLEGENSMLCRGERLIILRLLLGQLRKVPVTSPQDRTGDSLISPI